MSSYQRQARKLMRLHSPLHMGLRVFLILVGILLALATRIWVLEPIRIGDANMSPRAQVGSLVWVCRLPQCLEQIQPGSLVLLRTAQGKRIIRLVAATPGQQIQGDSLGTLKGSHFSIDLEENSWFFDTQTLTAFAQNQPIHLSDLERADLDFALKIYQREHPEDSLVKKARLWFNGKQAKLEQAQGVQVNGIPIQPNEIPSLNWQELSLVEKQLQQNDLQNRTVELKRYALIDSIPLDSFSPQQDYYLVFCLRSHNCVDSRELGPIPYSDLEGLVLGSLLPFLE